jgi:polyphosphate glucokinase
MDRAHIDSPERMKNIWQTLVPDLIGEVIMNILGIDVGGSAIKGAIVDTETGQFLTERIRIEMPPMSTPGNVSDIIIQIRNKVNYQGPVGVGFPAPIKHGVALMAANVDSSWVNTNVEELLSHAVGDNVFVINDADAAGIAEMQFGIGKDLKGVVILLTLGTGIGSAVFVDGKLVPNTEFGHMKIRGKDAEKRASAAVKKKKQLGWKEWTDRLQEFLDQMEILFNPDTFILGGGVSKDSKKFVQYLATRAQIIPAELENNAGIVGAALYVLEKTSKKI